MLSKKNHTLNSNARKQTSPRFFEMECLIKFQLLFNSLSISEQEVFIDSIAKQLGTKMIMSALFNHFKSYIQSNKASTMQYGIKHTIMMNDVSSDIIHQRDIDANNNNSNNNNEQKEILLQQGRN